MLTVTLAGVRFPAPVGLYLQELFLHNEIEFNISVSQPAEIDNLPLIDYTVLHQMAKQAIEEPAELLETLAQRLVKNIDKQYPGSRITVAVKKMNPPMAGEVAYSEVKWEQ